MHEASLARRLLRAALERVPDGRIVAVRGWIADAEALSAASLAFHFSAHARGTRAEGARVDLAVERPIAQCTACGHTYPHGHHVTLCPRCGSAEAEVRGRSGVGIDAIDIEAED